MLTVIDGQDGLRQDRRAMKILLSIAPAIVAALGVSCTKHRAEAAAPPPAAPTFTPVHGEADAVPMPPADSPRYQMTATGNKLYRIDTFTGRMWELRDMPTDLIKYRIMLPLDEEGGAGYRSWHYWGESKIVTPDSPHLKDD